ncbi:hypothetical protein PABY_12760 [Pyrodictium abyssi]|uniref:Uncharacterized protein n=1 Tax=Pyrodictium abyssi TaxID=54256 RepID=A0ABN6ZN85_9CREN|nr:hypothetical protein PABY_12760 [Pyrodictium abyssi]
MLGLIRYLAYAPLVFLLTLVGGVVILLELPSWLPPLRPG